MNGTLQGQQCTACSSPGHSLKSAANKDATAPWFCSLYPRSYVSCLKHKTVCTPAVSQGCSKRLVRFLKRKFEIQEDEPSSIPGFAAFRQITVPGPSSGLRAALTPQGSAEDSVRQGLKLESSWAPRSSLRGNAGLLLSIRSHVAQPSIHRTRHLALSRAQDQGSLNSRRSLPAPQ